jgi:phenylpyruvate tautomerase PptA (4-oxalocrotonate tautomerase family)
MPLVKIEIAQGKEKTYLLKLMNTVLDCVQHVLQVPADDRNIRLAQYDPEFFVMKKPYSLLIEITMFSGRSKETKKILYKKIVDELFDRLGIAQESVFIVLYDPPLENWGVRGGFPADEINLGFKVNV